MMRGATDTKVGDSAACRGPSSTDAAQLLRVWLSPSFPVGSFAYSHGLEAAVSCGLVRTSDDLARWIGALLDAGSVRNDLIILGEAWGATLAGDLDRLGAVNAVAVAFQPSAERYLEATQQGGSFVAAIAAAWPCEAVTAFHARSLDDAVAVAYPVAVGVAAAGHGIGREDVAGAYALAFAMNLVSAAIRLSVIGQTDGQRVIARMMSLVETAAQRSIARTMDDLGGAAYSSDLASLEHETLYSRLFRS